MHSTILTWYTNHSLKWWKRRKSFNSMTSTFQGPEHRRLEERVPTMVTTRANDETDGLTTQSPFCHLPLTMLTTKSTKKLWWLDLKDTQIKLIRRHQLMAQTFMRHGPYRNNKKKRFASDVRDNITYHNIVDDDHEVYANDLKKRVREHDKTWDPAKSEKSGELTETHANWSKTNQDPGSYLMGW